VATLLVATADAAGAQTEVYVAVGDSITEGIGDDTARPEKGYPPRLEDLLQAAGRDVTVLNQGKQGETTGEAVSRIREVLNITRADKLLLMEGTNDIPLVSNETILFNLGEIARRAAEFGTETVHATLFPRHRAAGRDGNNAVTGEVSALVRELAWATDRDLVDPFDFFFHHPQIDSLYRVGDRFHPNAQGYDLMADLFFDVLTDVDSMPPVIGRVSPPDRSERISPGAEIRVDVYDFGTGIDVDDTGLRINGVPVQAEARGDESKLTLLYRSPTPLSGVLTVEMDGRDHATPPNAVVRRAARYIVAGTVLLDGDIDRDGRVDGHDLVRLARAFGSTRNTPLYSNAADVNHDGIIDGNDLALLAANFGRTAS
jgi:lysophospholipase L1-like esterase